jgi:hypothetical protein
MASKENPALGEAGLPNHSALAAEPSEDKRARQEPQAAVERHGNWLVLGGDVTGKRIECRCSQCQRVTVIGREALEGGAGVTCPGCSAPRYELSPAVQSRRFATDVAHEEVWRSRRRHRGTLP